MKKKILQLLMGAIFLMLLLVSTANAQTFIASFGVQQNWGVPYRVSHYIDNNYYDYKWVHAREVVHHGNVEFEVILQRRNVYLQVTLDRFGHVYKTVRRDYYPLYNHECSDYCGFHSNYYVAYRSSFNNHDHDRYDSHYYKPRGNAYGHYKNHGNGYNKHGNKGHGNGYNAHGDYNNGDRGHGRSEGSREGYKNRDGNGAGKPNNNGRQPVTSSSRRPN